LKIGLALRGARGKEGKTALEGRMAGMEGIMEQVSERLNHIDSEISELRRTDRWIMGLLFFM